MTSYISGWYLFWHHLKKKKKVEAPKLYIGNQFRVTTFGIDNPEEDCNYPISENMFGKMLQRARVK